MAENNLEHSQNMKERSLEADIKDTQDGRWYGLVALLALITAATICGVTGHEVLAGAFLGAGVLGVIGSLINGKSKN